MQKPTVDQIKHRYNYHAPKDDQAKRYEEIRAACCDLALKITELTPFSPEQSKALSHLDEVMMLANAAIASNE